MDGERNGAGKKKEGDVDLPLCLSCQEQQAEALWTAKDVDLPLYSYIRGA